MVFADLKNDFVFRRIFAKHPDILAGLLNDLLDRRGERTIEGIEYLPSEQLPLVEGAKLSILDVRCRDRAGTTFVVEMQLLHVAGFVNRVVYNACKAYVDQLGSGEPYAGLADVVAVSICDFEIWPDARQDASGAPRVPMMSRWQMTEQSSRAGGLLQVQYAFLELPKLLPTRPDGGADLWAWLFVHAPELEEIPAGLPAGPFRAAMELANEASFTRLELEAYRKVMDEIQQLRDYVDQKLAEGRAEGRAEGLAKGLAKGVARGSAEAILTVLAARGIGVDEETRARIVGCEDVGTLERWLARAAVVGSGREVVEA
jgi:predicted transposase/invertase (TIGR01784 family)